jgi:hypothetical protein
LQPSSFFKEPSITNHFGLRVGDRDGDGKADIGYRGKCGSNPSVPRWRYHLSTGSGFSVVCSDTYDF